MVALLSGGAAGLAGCSGDGGSGDTPTATDSPTESGSDDTDTPTSDDPQTEEETEAGEIVTDTITGYIQRLPLQFNFNPFSRKNFPSKFIDFANMHLAWDRTGYGLETGWCDYEVQGGGKTPPTVTVTLEEGYQWWNGNAVTAEDLYTELKIDYLSGNPDRSGSPPELVDDYTLKVPFDEPMQADIAAAEVLEEEIIQTPRWQWGSYLERLEDATTAEEIEQIDADIGERTIDIDTAIGNGPYEVDQVSSSEIRMTLNEEHPHAEQINIPNLHLKVGGEDKVVQMTINDDLDIGHDPLERRMAGAMEAVPDHIQTVGEYPNGEQYKLHFNFNNDHLARVNVRRAIHEIVDVQEIYDSSPMWGVPATYQTGMGAPMSEKYLGDEFLSNIYEYSFEANEEQATEFMEMAGYSKQGGTWTDGDGNEAQIEFKCSDWASWVTPAKILQSQLSDFGFEIDLMIKNSDQWRPEIYNYNFDLTPWWGGFGPGVAYDLDETSQTGHYTSVNTEPDDPSDVENAETYRTSHNKPLVWEVPQELGALELGDNPMKINWLQEWRKFTTAESEEAVANYAKKMARIHNFWVPDINLTDVTAGAWGDTKNFDWPAKDSNEYKRGNYGPDYLLHWGAVQAKTE